MRSQCTGHMQIARPVRGRRLYGRDQARVALGLIQRVDCRGARGVVCLCLYLHVLCVPCQASVDLVCDLGHFILDQFSEPFILRFIPHNTSYRWSLPVASCSLYTSKMASQSLSKWCTQNGFFIDPRICICYDDNRGIHVVSGDVSIPPNTTCRHSFYCMLSI